MAIRQLDSQTKSGNCLNVKYDCEAKREFRSRGFIMHCSEVKVGRRSTLRRDKASQEDVTVIEAAGEEKEMWKLRKRGVLPPAAAPATTRPRRKRKATCVAKNSNGKQLAKVFKQPEHTLHPVPQPTPHPVPQPTPHPVPQPTQHPVPQPTPHPVPQPTPHPVQQPTPHPVPQPTPHPVQQPTPHPVPQPTPHQVQQPTQHPVPQPTPHPVPEPMPELAMDLHEIAEAGDLIARLDTNTDLMRNILSELQMGNKRAEQSINDLQTDLQTLLDGLKTMEMNQRTMIRNLEESGELVQQL